MHVCHVITRMILGGAQENTLLTCERLAARGHRVTLISGPAIGPEGSLEERARGGGYRFLVLPEMRRRIDPMPDAISLRRLAAWFGRLRPDVVHTHSSKAGVLGRLAAARAGGPHVVHTIHGLPFHAGNPAAVNLAYVALERHLARRTDLLISVADAMTRQALAAGVGRPEQFVTIPSGMEVERYPAGADAAAAWRRGHGFADGDVLIVQVARLAPLKGCVRVLAAAATLTEEFPRARFLFLGDGALRGELQRRIDAAGLAGRVHLLGLVPPDEIPAALTAADILVHASDHEGLPRAVVQGRLCGVPAVAYDVDGTREVLADGRNGVLVAAPPEPEGSPPTRLIAALRRLLADEALRQKLAAADESLLRGRFSAEAMTDAIEAAYRAF